MTNAVYQTTVEELEALISPRVVSRALQEGLRLVGKTPETITVDDVDKILKEQVFRQLQVTMAVTEAKLKITQIIERLRLVGSEPASTQRNLAQQEETLLALQESLKPFNLYFEWPEVQKLRAQLKLLEAEQEAGHEATRLIQDARQQLRLIEQKQEDQLVNQARILTDLEASLEEVKAVGGPKVRRLENLMGQVQEAQDRRQLATAESERALKLVVDLRKLLESGSFAEPAADAPAAEHVQQTAPSPEALNPAIDERLKQIDLGSERHDLEKLANDHANLLVYNKDLAETVIRSRSLLDAHTSIAEMLELLPARFQEATLEQRQTLQAEVQQMQAAAAEFGAIDLSDFEQRVQILTGILESSLPSPRDMQHLRSLFQLAQTRYAEAHAQAAENEAARQEQLNIQGQAIESLEASLEQHGDNLDLMAELGSLQTAVSALKQDHEAGHISSNALNEARQAETQLLAAVAQRAQTGQEREQAQLRSLLSEFQSLPVESSLQESAQSFAEKLSVHLNEEAIDAATVTSLQADLEAYKKLLRETYHVRLEGLSQRAETLGASSLVSYLGSVAAEISQDVYPNIDDIENSLRTALETRQREQLEDINVLEEELEAFGADTPGVASLAERLAEARSQLERGELMEDLHDIQTRITGLNASLERRAADFIPRLDSALESFEQVSKLNSEEVTELRLILKHLDSQRDALERVSAGVKNDLEASLTKVETMLVELEQQYEATQAVADQLAGGNALDGLFDLFGDGADSLFGDDDLVLEDVEKQEDTA